MLRTVVGLPRGFAEVRQAGFAAPLQEQPGHWQSKRPITVPRTPAAPSTDRDCRRLSVGSRKRRIDLPRGSIRLAMHKEEAPLDCPEQDGRKVRGRNRLPFRSHIALARTRRQPAIRHRAKGVSGFLTKGCCRGRTQQTYFRAPRNPKASTCPYQLGSSMPLRSARWPPSVPSLSCSNRGRSASTPNPLGGGDGHDPKDQGHEDCGNEPTDVIRVEHAPTTYIKFYLLVTILSGRPSSTLMNCGPIALRFPKI
jgi:hypothetical protein